MQFGHVTAQEEFAALLKQRVGPALRQSGFKGSSGRYELRVGGNALLVGLQRSSWSTSEQIEFTLNWTIVHGTVWQEVRRLEPWVGNWPNHNCDVLGTTWNGRIHDLVEGGDPMDWWVIDAPTDSGVHARNSSVMEEVVAQVSSLLLPLALPVLADDDAYLDAVLRRHSEVPGTPPEALYLVSLVRERADERELRELVERLTGTAGLGTVHKDARRLGSELAAELGVSVQLDAEDDEHEDAGGMVVASREDIAEELWRYGEDELALAALDCDDATLRRIMQVAFDPAAAPVGDLMLSTMLALGAVEVLEGAPRTLARKRRRPEAQLREFWRAAGPRKDGRMDDPLAHLSLID